MANTNNRLTLESVTGMHIYTDDKGRKIYYKPRKFTGYVIKQENVKTYTTMANRFMMAVVALILGFLILDSWELPTWISIVISAAVLAFMQYRFHVKFLPSLVQVHNFVPTAKPSKIESMAKDELWRLLIKTILYPIFGTLLVVEFYIQKSSLIMLLAGWAILVATLVLSGFCIVAIIYKKNHPQIIVSKKAKKKKQGY